MTYLSLTIDSKEPKVNCICSDTVHGTLSIPTHLAMAMNHTYNVSDVINIKDNSRNETHT